MPVDNKHPYESSSLVSAVLQRSTYGHTGRSSKFSIARYFPPRNLYNLRTRMPLCRLAHPIKSGFRSLPLGESAMMSMGSMFSSNDLTTPALKRRPLSNIFVMDNKLVICERTNLVKITKNSRDCVHNAHSDDSGSENSGDGVHTSF